jgi:pyruvate dehydrogenase E2 component (dihydrolipoamide acetyltransferase)
MAKIVGLPKLSPTMEEGTLARWVKKEGDALEVDDLVAEVETDKATMEWRALDKGVLLKILVPEGSTLKPDVPVAIVGQRGEDISALIEQAKSGAPPAAAPKGPAVPVGPSAAVARAAVAQASAPAASTPAPVQATVAPAQAPAPQASGRVFASPLVRKLAREQGIDLHGVEGSGPHGRVVKRDLDATPKAASAPAAAASAPRAALPAQRSTPGGVVVQPLSQMRKTIARRLTESKQTVPHFYLTIDVDAQPIVDARAVLNEALAEGGGKVSVNDLLIKAVAIALRRVPECNASFMGSDPVNGSPRGEIHFHQVVDISVAVAVADGLVTPVVRDADKLGVVAISEQVKDLAARAKAKKLKPEEMQNGTFSISNLGMFGIENFAAVINPPEGAILAVGAVRDEPVVKNGAVVPGKRMRMTLSCDHRVVDGAVGAKFLAALKKLLEAPIGMIA